MKSLSKPQINDRSFTINQSCSMTCTFFPDFFFSVDQSWYVSKVLIVSNDPYESISGDQKNRECRVFSFFFFFGKVHVVSNFLWTFFFLKLQFPQSLLQSCLCMIYPQLPFYVSLRCAIPIPNRHVVRMNV